MDVVFNYFFPGDCYNKVIKDFNFFDDHCIKLAFARCLSLAVLLGALAVKVPQIIKVLQSHSIEGLSYLAYIFELAAVTFSSTYSFAKEFPFSTWGESLFISIQIVFLIALMGIIENNIPFLAIFFTIYSGLVWYLVSGMAPLSLLATLQGTVIPLMAFSRITTVYTIYKNGTTGQLSFITAFLNFGGAAARIFTTLQETQDLLLLVSFSVSFLLNTTIVFQFLWYWNSSKKHQGQKKD